MFYLQMQQLCCLKDILSIMSLVCTPVSTSIGNYGLKCKQSNLLKPLSLTSLKLQFIILGMKYSVQHALLMLFQLTYLFLFNCEQ